MCFFLNLLVNMCHMIKYISIVQYIFFTFTVIIICTLAHSLANSSHMCVDRKSINGERAGVETDAKTLNCSVTSKAVSGNYKSTEKKKITTNIKTYPELQVPPLSLKLVSNKKLLPDCFKT